jgi:hypothetical protein
MFQKRSLTTGFLVASLGIAAGFAVVSTPDVAAAGDCDKHKGKVKDVCEKSGGKEGIKKAMKKAMDAANAKGAKIDGKALECKSCHSDLKDYKTTPNAEKDFGTHLEPNFGG